MISAEAASGPPGAILGKPAIASDGTNFFVVWRDSRDFATNGYDIYGARVTPDGTVLDPNGIPISTCADFDNLPDDQYIPSVAFDGTNYMVVWTANRNPSIVDYEVYAARVAPDGTVLDPDGLQLTTGEGPLRMPSIVFDGTNYFIAWRNSSSEIRGARLSTGGVNLDGPTSFFIGIGFYPYVAYDGTNYMVVWHNWGAGGDLDIFGATVSKGGDVLASFPVCTADADQDHCSIAFGGTNYLVVWHDERGGSDSVYGARVSPDGTVLDSPAFKIGERSGPGVAVVFDGTNYLVAFSMDNSEPYFRLNDVYYRRVSKDGTLLDKKGIPIATAHGHEWHPVIGFDNDTYLLAWNYHLCAGGCYDGCVAGHIIQAGTLPQSVPASPAASKISGGWTEETSPTNLGLYTIWCFDENNVFAGGWGDKVIQYTGSTWDSQTQSGPGRPYDMWGIDQSDLWAIGWAWMVYQYDGQNWSEIFGACPFPPEETYGPGLGIWGTSNTNIMTVGADGYSSYYNGASWTQKPTGVSTDLSDLWGSSSSNIYAVGEFGTVIRYGGSQWTQQSDIPTIQRLNGIWGISANNIFAVGDFGAIIHYDGTSWSSQESGTMEHLYGVWSSDSSHVFAVGHGGTILHYDGSEWYAEESGTTQDLFGVSGAGDYVWAVGNQGTILKKTWRTTTTFTAVLQGGLRPYPTPNGYDVPLTLKVYDQSVTLDMNNILLTSGQPGYIAPLYTLTKAAGNITITNTDKSIKTITCQETELPVGTYDITLFTPHALITLRNDVVIASGTSFNMGTLLEGNADDGEQIAGADFSLLLDDYLATPNSPPSKWMEGRCDFDRNNQVTSVDFSLMIGNYNKTSPQIVQ